MWIKRHSPSLLVAPLLALAAAALLWSAAVAQAAPTPPSLVSPAEGFSFPARTTIPTFTATAPPGKAVFFRVSSSPALDTQGLIGLDESFFVAMGSSAPPPPYEGSPSFVSPFLRSPGTYYWQASYFGCDGTGCGDVGSEVWKLVVTPLAPPKAISPPDGARFPYGSTVVLKIQDKAPDTGLVSETLPKVELGLSARLDADGSFVESWGNGALPISSDSVSQPQGIYQASFGPPFTKSPGTYYWHGARRDCDGTTDQNCLVGDSNVRSFSIGRPSGSGGGGGGGSQAKCAKAKKSKKAAKKKLKKAKKTGNKKAVKKAKKKLKRAKKRVRKYC